MLLRKFGQWFGVMLLGGLSLLMTGPGAEACVGKSLVIGNTGTVQQAVLAELLSVLISERTGTSVKVVEFANATEAHQALLQADLDMVVSYTGVGQVEILHGAAIADAKELYQAVKETFNQDLNLVWLKPLGFAEPKVAPAGTVAEAAPVVRKDTLKKFPALARLIDKLGGKIDEASMHELELEAAQSTPHKVARNFLKKQRMI